MADNGRTTVYLRGTAMWAKITGDPKPNYAKDGNEWTMELDVDDDGKKQLKSLGIADKIKEKDDRTFIRFKQKEFRNDFRTGGEVRNDPPKIVDAAGQPWTGGDIGNGSVVDVKFTLRDYGKGKPKGVYIAGVRVLEHVAYERQDFAPLSADDEYFSKASEVEKNQKANDTSERPDGDLNDEVPF